MSDVRSVGRWLPEQVEALRENKAADHKDHGEEVSKDSAFGPKHHRDDEDQHGPEVRDRLVFSAWYWNRENDRRKTHHRNAFSKSIRMLDHERHVRAIRRNQECKRGPDPSIVPPMPLSRDTDAVSAAFGTVIARRTAQVIAAILTATILLHVK